jgi:cell division septum initiation protein DivIVA
MNVQTNTLFKEEVNGYDRAQVNTAMERLQAQYKALYAQWETLNKENNDLRTSNQQLTAENERLLSRVEETNPAVQAAFRNPTDIMDTVLRHGANIIADAKKEAEAILLNARVESLGLLTQILKTDNKLQSTLPIERSRVCLPEELGR